MQSEHPIKGASVHSTTNETKIMLQNHGNSLLFRLGAEPHVAKSLVCVVLHYDPRDALAMTVRSVFMETSTTPSSIRYRTAYCTALHYTQYVAIYFSHFLLCGPQCTVRTQCGTKRTGLLHTRHTSVYLPRDTPLHTALFNLPVLPQMLFECVLYFSIVKSHFILVQSRASLALVSSAWC